MQTISLQDWSSLIDLERAYYEKRSYEALLSYMAENTNTNTKQYFNEYVEVTKKYKNLCNKLETEIILPAVGDTPVHWEVDFIEREVKIREASM